MFTIVEFPSEEATLRGRLYQPEDATSPAPIVIMAHGFSATINGMVADRYAELFHEAGLAVLLYDHRGFGISGGEPRQEINEWSQAQGYRDAISFVTSLPEIDADRIAIWGDSMSGGVAIVVAAIDRRVKAVVVQVPGCGDEMPPPDPDGALFESMQKMLVHGDFRTLPKTTVGPMPVVSVDQLGTPSHLMPLTAFHWFIEYGGRYGTHWENQATYTSPETTIPWHPGLCAPHLKASLLMMIAQDDEMPGASSSVARKVFDLAPQPKHLLEIDGGHFGLLYYPSELFTQASRAQCAFLLEHLGVETARISSKVGE